MDSTVLMRNEFLQSLRSVVGEKPGIIVLHSSLAKILPTAAPNRWDVLYAIGILAGEGWTIAAPAFTFSFCRGGVFDVWKSPSETGVLADWILEAFPDAKRTTHPIYSFAVLGPRTSALLGCASATTFGDDSPFGLFEREDAVVVMAGCGWDYCTQFHRYEEVARVPYRVFKVFSGTSRNAQGIEEAVNATMFVRDLDLSGVNDFLPVVQRMNEAGEIKRESLWRGAIEAARVSSIRTACEVLLEQGPLSLVSNKIDVQTRINRAKEAERAAPLRIALLGSSNLDIARNGLTDRLQEVVPQRKSEITTLPFGQLFQQIVQPNSELNVFAPEVSIFCDRIEDLLSVASLDRADMQLAAERVRLYADNIAAFAGRHQSWIVVHRFAAMGNFPAELNIRLIRHVEQLNGILHDILADVPQIVWVDPGSEAAQVGAPFDPRLWFLGRIPFSSTFTARLVERWTGIVAATLEKTTRLIVLDLDNTLWGGVLGEDGIDGIKIGGDYPGNAFADFQQALKALSERGIALAVCSKNDEDLALNALENHDEMVLRRSDIVSHRINWSPKWQNIRDIAQELDLGLGSVLFIDDNPVERESVMRNLPEVRVLDLPADATKYTEALRACLWLESVKVGKEDRQRVESYKARQKINEQRQKSASLDDFLRSLDMKLFIDRIDDSNIGRAAQLCQKTNQFNTTTYRYTARDLQQMVADGADVATVGLADKYTQREIIGLIILKPLEGRTDGGLVDLFLLSCRVLGRTVEKAVVSWATERAKQRGWSELAGLIVETPRNTPARGVFQDEGFAFDADSGLWRKATSNVDTSLPAWFEQHGNYN